MAHHFAGLPQELTSNPTMRGQRRHRSLLTVTMDENPYKSSESELSVEKLPETSSDLARRRKQAYQAGFMVMGGLVLLQAIAVELLWPFVTARYLQPIRNIMFVVFLLLASPFGVLMGLWTWRGVRKSR